MKCDVSLDELEKDAQAPENQVELQKDVVRQHWKSYTICDALWHVHVAWKGVTASCIRGAWKKLCPNLAFDLGGLWPVWEAFPGAPQVPRVGEEGWPRRGRRRQHGLFVGVVWRGAAGEGARRTGEAAVSVGGGDGGWAVFYSHWWRRWPSRFCKACSGCWTRHWATWRRWTQTTNGRDLRGVGSWPRMLYENRREATQSNLFCCRGQSQFPIRFERSFRVRLSFAWHWSSMRSVSFCFSPSARPVLVLSTGGSSLLGFRAPPLTWFSCLGLGLAAFLSFCGLRSNHSYIPSRKAVYVVEHVEKRTKEVGKKEKHSSKRKKNCQHLD